MIKFKDPKLKAELDGAPLLLQIIVKDMALYCYENFSGRDITITRILGKIEGDSGVHAACRAADIREEFEGQHLFTPQERTQLLDYLNSKYARNDGKLTIIYHSFQEQPFHFHVQIAESNMVYMHPKS